ncbi:nitronate monooxygenase [Chloroflexota bacterium]
MLKTAICNLLDIKYPIIQGGMAHISTAKLVSAVSNAGGLGIVGAGYYEPDWVRKQILLTRQKTSQPFGVNIPLTSPFTEEIINVILEEKVPVVTTGNGNPKIYISKFKEAGIKVIPVVASATMAKQLESAGVEAIIAEGTEAAGHIGETTTMTLIPQVVDNISIPVIAAGGIADGRGLASVLALGAQGVQMGTRFVCSNECPAHSNYKQEILRAHSTIVTRQSTGYPLRSLSNKLTDQFLALEKAGATKEELEFFDRNRTYLGLIEGKIEEGSLLAGQVTGLIKEIKPVKTIIEETVTEAEKLIRSLNDLYRED